MGARRPRERGLRTGEVTDDRLLWNFHSGCESVNPPRPLGMGAVAYGQCPGRAYTLLD